MVTGPTSAALGVWVALVLAGCTTPPPRVTESVVAIRTVPGCEPPGPVSSLRVTALGDFAAGDDTVEVLAGGDGLTIDRFPETTRALAVLAEGPGAFEAGGIADVAAGAVTAPLLLLPFDASCALGDSAAHGFTDGVTAVTPAGVLVAGGLDGEVATRRTVFLPANGSLVAIVGDGMANRRLGATATAVDNRVVIAGGSAGEEGAADDTFEVFDAATTAFVPDNGGSLCGTSSSCAGRRDHGAAAIGGDGVLLVGGAAASDGAPLDDAVIVHAGDGTVDREVGALPKARRFPAAITLDDGTVLIIGGLGKGGAWTGTVYAFDPVTKFFEDARDGDDDPLSLLPRERGAVVALPGARFVWVGGEVLGEMSRSLTLCMRIAPDEGTPRFDCTTLDDALPVDLTSLRVAGNPGGGILLTGNDGAESRAFFLDPSGAAPTRELPATRTPLALAALADGTLVEVGTDGTSLRRIDLHTQLEAPPNSYLPGGAADLAFDAVDRWVQTGGTLHAAVDDARVTVPLLRFARFDATLDADSGTDILLTGEGAAPTVIRMAADDISVGLCRIPRSDGDLLTIARDGHKLTLQTTPVDATDGEPTAKVVCTVPELPARAGISLRALAGVTIRRFAVARR